MYAAAAKYADSIYVTSDNPRTESPEKIIEQILAEASDIQRLKTHREVNREQAIKACLKAAKKNDTVLIAGKGHEDYQIIGDQKLKFDDREVAMKYL